MPGARNIMVNEESVTPQLVQKKSSAFPVPLFEGHVAAFQPRMQLWLANSDDVGFGHGRMELFRLIGSMGSLSKAARALGMSYRAAWGKIKGMEQAIGVRLVCSQGAKRDGYVLTPEALALMDAFERWFADVQSYATERAQQYFPASVVEAADAGTEYSHVAEDGLLPAPVGQGDSGPETSGVAGRHEGPLV